MLTDITVIGGINIDIEGSPFAELRREDSNPGTVTMAFGGVGRNITENLARMGGKVAMISVIGDDHMGIGAREHLRSLGVDVSLIQSVKGRNSAMYLSILNHDNDMELAICDMDIISHITPDLIEKNRNVLEKSKVIALDGNLEEETIRYVTDSFFPVPLFLGPRIRSQGGQGKRCDRKICLYKAKCHGSGDLVGNGDQKRKRPEKGRAVVHRPGRWQAVRHS